MANFRPTGKERQLDPRCDFGQNFGVAKGRLDVAVKRFQQRRESERDGKSRGLARGSRDHDNSRKPRLDPERQRLVSRHEDAGRQQDVRISSSSRSPGGLRARCLRSRSRGSIPPRQPESGPRSARRSTSRAVIYSAVGSAAAHIDSAAVEPALSACALSEVEHATQPDRPFTTIAPHAGRTGFPFDFEHWCRRQTRCEYPAHDPTAPSRP